MWHTMFTESTTSSAVKQLKNEAKTKRKKNTKYFNQPMSIETDTYTTPQFILVLIIPILLHQNIINAFNWKHHDIVRWRFLFHRFCLLCFFLYMIFRNLLLKWIKWVCTTSWSLQSFFLLNALLQSANWILWVYVRLLICAKQNKKTTNTNKQKSRQIFRCTRNFDTIEKLKPKYEKYS